MPIRYTTEVLIPESPAAFTTRRSWCGKGARLLLARAEKGGITSEIHQRELADTPVTRPLIRHSAEWAPVGGFTYNDTRTAYGSSTVWKNHAGSAGGLRLNVQAGATWTELNLSDDVVLDGDRVERMLESLRELIPDAEASINAKRLHFETGQRFRDYIDDIKVDFKRDDVTP